MGQNNGLVVKMAREVMKRPFAVALLCLSQAGCEVQAPPPKKNLVLERTDRFQVVRVATFEDRLAYGNTRGIYIIRDLQSGKEYVGMSGVGISELGQHPRNAGKQTHIVPDER